MTAGRLKGVRWWITATFAGTRRGHQNFPKPAVIAPRLFHVRSAYCLAMPEGPAAILETVLSFAGGSGKPADRIAPAGRAAPIAFARWRVVFARGAASPLDFVA
jgi:hypothetical protein